MLYYLMLQIYYFETRLICHSWNRCVMYFMVHTIHVYCISWYFESCYLCVSKFKQVLKNEDTQNGLSQKHSSLLVWQDRPKPCYRVTSLEIYFFSLSWCFKRNWVAYIPTHIHVRYLSVPGTIKAVIIGSVFTDTCQNIYIFKPLCSWWIFHQNIQAECSAHTHVRDYK